MLLEALISTTYKRHSNAILLAKDIFRMSGVRSIIICQLFDFSGDDEFPFDIEEEFGFIYFVRSKGLSVSRNAAISKSTARFGWILDDDVQVSKDGVNALLSYLRKDLSIAAVSCKFTDEVGQTRKKYQDVAFKHNRNSVMKVSSIEIVLNLDYIKSNKLFFDTRFGLGARYPSGEENIILSDIILSGGVVLFFPMVLCFHSMVTSSTVLYSHAQWQAKGALIRRVFGSLGIVMLAPFVLKRIVTKQAKFSLFLSSFRQMLIGFFNVTS